MNRVRIALALLAGLLALSFFSHRQVLRITDGTLETRYEAREAMRSADYERATKRAGDAAQQGGRSCVQVYADRIAAVLDHTVERVG